MATVTDGREVGLPVGDRETAGWWHPADGAIAVAIVAPGAGNSVRDRYFDGIVSGLRDERVAAFRFDFVYGHLGRRSPDPPAVLLDAWRAAIAATVELGGGLPMIATGKSMGGRYASMLAAEEGSAFLPRGLVFFGYPLHAPGTPEKQRSEHLFDVTVSMLFVEGTRDPFARRDLLEPVLERLGDRASVEWIEGGDHSHRVRGVRRSDTDIGEDLGRRAGAFARGVLEGGA
jgi:predicted alpha/beta-hydrolase family hydrolase